MKAGVAPPLFVFLDWAGSEDADQGADLATSTLDEFFLDGSRNVDFFIEAGVVEPLVRLFERRSGDERRFAAEALARALVSTREKKNLHRALALGAARIFAACLPSANIILANNALSGLLIFLNETNRGSTSLAAQIAEGCNASCLVNVLDAGKLSEKTSAHLVALLTTFASVEAHSLHASLLGAGLPRALIAAATRGAVPGKLAPPLITRPDLPFNGAADSALFILSSLLEGPVAVEAAEAVVAADGLKLLVTAMPLGGQLAESSARCLLSITRRTGPHRPAVVAARAVPALLKALEMKTGVAAAFAAKALLNLVDFSHSVEATVKKAGYRSPRLVEIANR